MATIQGEDSKTKYAVLFLDDLIKGIDPITKQNAAAVAVMTCHQNSSASFPNKQEYLLPRG